MASQPLRRALEWALQGRAEARLGPGATALDYVELWLTSGKTFRLLSQDVAKELGRPLSRNFVSFVCNRLAIDARDRILAARRAAAHSPS